MFGALIPIESGENFGFLDRNELLRQVLIKLITQNLVRVKEFMKKITLVLVIIVLLASLDLQIAPAGRNQGAAITALFYGIVLNLI